VVCVSFRNIKPMPLEMGPSYSVSSEPVQFFHFLQNLRLGFF
jgi:hypothetical protein